MSIQASIDSMFGSILRGAVVKNVKETRTDVKDIKKSGVKVNSAMPKKSEVIPIHDEAALASYRAHKEARDSMNEEDYFNMKANHERETNTLAAQLRLAAHEAQKEARAKLQGGDM